MDSGNPMLIQIDPIHSPHVHEPGTAFLLVLVIAETLVAPCFACSAADTFHSALVSVALAGGVPLRWAAEYCSHAALWPDVLLRHVPSRPFPRRDKTSCFLLE